MTKDVDVPETIGELVELLDKYPKDMRLQVSILQFDDFGVLEDLSQKMRIHDDWSDDTIFITFGNGDILP